MKNEKGFIPVMLTPFKDNGAIDFEELTRLTEFYLEAGASGLFANCLSSEMFELTKAERLELVKHIVKIANGKVPVVATGTFKDSIEGQADFIKQMHGQGVHAVIAITGILAEQNDSDEKFNDCVFKLIDLTEKIPLGFYECPVPYKRVLSPGQLALFVNTGRVIYHKDTSLDLENVAAKNKACSHMEKFGLYDAYMGHAVNSLRAGSAGLSCIQGNFFPELIVWLCNNYDNSKMKGEVDHVQDFLIANMEVMHASYPTVAKYFLQKRGMKTTLFSRRGSVPLTQKETLKIDTLYDDYSELKSALGIHGPEVKQVSK
jgi:4-hydroxy-tetrahydrodipicolinate synthase